MIWDVPEKTVTLKSLHTSAEGLFWVQLSPYPSSFKCKIFVKRDFTPVLPMWVSWFFWDCIFSYKFTMFGGKDSETREMDPRENLIYFIIKPPVHSAHFHTHSVNISWTATIWQALFAPARVTLLGKPSSRLWEGNSPVFPMLFSQSAYSISLLGDMGNIKPFNGTTLVLAQWLNYLLSWVPHMFPGI